MNNERIFLSAPDVGSLEEEYVLSAIRGGWIAPLGPEVDAFERDVASLVGVDHAVALSSGTAALHLGLLALGVKAGDTVITSTMTFAATANAIVYTGAEPYFVDCEFETGNMDPRLLEESIAELRSDGHHIAAIIPVDLLGKAVNYTEILQISDKYGIPVLSDAAESLGASHNGQPAGSFGVASILSFNGNKVITTSGGGMLLTNDAGIEAKVRYLATQARQPVVHYEHEDIGYNYRMSNLLAALGRAQLSRLDSMISQRKEMRDAYKSLFATVPGVEIFGGNCDSEDNYWLTSIVVDPSSAGWSAQELSSVLNEQNIENRPLWKPMHLQPVFAKAEASVNGNSEYLFTHGLTLPSGSSLSSEQRETVFAAIKEFLLERANA